MLTDGDLVKTVSLPMAKEIGDKAWIQYEFPQPQTIRALTIVSGKRNAMDVFLPPGGDSGKALEASDDGQNFHVVLEVPKGGATEHTLSFAPVTAKYFRVTFKTQPVPPNPFADFGMPQRSPPPTDHFIAELVLHPGARVNRFEEKAAFNPVCDLYAFATPDFTPQDVNQQERRRRPDQQDASRRHSRLDSARRQLGRGALRLLAARHHQPSRHQGSHWP